MMQQDTQSANSPFSWIDQQLDDLRARQLYRSLRNRDLAQSATIQMAGKNLLNFASNDYLGLANDPRILSSVTEATQTYGWGAGSSPLISGHSQLHAIAEERLAQFEGTEAGLLFPTGFAANVGTIVALTDANSIVFSDEKNHASIIDGCRLSGARVVVYPHNDIQQLSIQMERLAEPKDCHGDVARKLIASDGLFSMDGDLADLPGLVDLAERHHAMLLVDEAHATGVLGAGGRGACEQLGVHSPTILRTGTLSKALGSLGGFVVGSHSLVDWLVNRCRTLIYSTAAPAAICAAALTALDIVEQEPERRIQLLARATALRERLEDGGWRVGDSASQIIPILLGDPQITMDVSDQLRSRGILIPAIRPPSVPQGESLLRISLSFDHTDAMIDELLKALHECRY